MGETVPRFSFASTFLLSASSFTESDALFPDAGTEKLMNYAIFGRQ